MGVTLDTGAVDVYQKCFQLRSHPLNEHILAWSVKKLTVSTPSVAWAEYWRARSSNDHFVARVRKRIRIASVSQQVAEFAADALRTSSVSVGRNSVKHLVDAIVMAHANDAADAVYTTDIDDFEKLWDCFPHVKALVSATTGEVVRKR